MIGAEHHISFTQSPIQIRLIEIPADRYDVLISLDGGIWSQHDVLSQDEVFAFIKGFRLGAEYYEMTAKIEDDKAETARVIAEIERANAKSRRNID
jgi:hypothetical protein